MRLRIWFSFIWETLMGIEIKSPNKCVVVQWRRSLDLIGNEIPYFNVENKKQSEEHWTKVTNIKKVRDEKKNDQRSLDFCF